MPPAAHGLSQQPLGLALSFYLIGSLNILMEELDGLNSRLGLH